MQINLLKEIVTSIAGAQASGIVNLLFGKKNVNEFLIAKKLNLTINQTRNILYKLAEDGLVSFIRKKDKKKGGWYTYFWTLSTERSLSVLKNLMQKRIDFLIEQIEEKKKGRFYFCKNCNQELTEDNALLTDFICPECGEVLELKDNSTAMIELEKEIIKMENHLKGVEGELLIIGQKDQKTRIRKAKVEVKKKALERLKKRKAREKENKKLKKKEKKAKTPIKKKVKKKKR